MRKIRRREEPQALTPAEVGRLVELARSRGDEAMALLIRLLYESGARISEALSLRPCDIVPPRAEDIGAWAVLPNLKRKRRPGEKHPTKRVVITAELARELLEFARLRGVRPDGPVFASPRSPGVPLSRQAAWAKLKDICALAGVSRVGRDGRLKPAWPHTLRHGAAVRLVMSGVPVPVVQGQLGHASLQTTQRYFELTEEERLKLLAEALAQ